MENFLSPSVCYRLLLTFICNPFFRAFNLSSNSMKIHELLCDMPDDGIHICYAIVVLDAM